MEMERIPELSHNLRAEVIIDRVGVSHNLGRENPIPARPSHNLGKEHGIDRVQLSHNLEPERTSTNTAISSAGSSPTSVE